MLVQQTFLRSIVKHFSNVFSIVALLIFAFFIFFFIYSKNEWGLLSLFVCLRSNCAENIRKHILHTGKHEGVKMYNCPKCSYATNSPMEFRNHLKENHTDIENPDLAYLHAGNVRLCRIWTKIEKRVYTESWILLCLKIVWALCLFPVIICQYYCSQLLSSPTGSSLSKRNSNNFKHCNQLSTVAVGVFSLWKQYLPSLWSDLFALTK